MSKVAVRRRIKAAHIATEHAIPTLSSYISVEYLKSHILKHQGRVYNIPLALPFFVVEINN